MLLVLAPFFTMILLELALELLAILEMVDQQHQQDFALDSVCSLVLMEMSLSQILATTQYGS